jgi:hypothetical protein
LHHKVVLREGGAIVRLPVGDNQVAVRPEHPDEAQQWRDSFSDESDDPFEEDYIEGLAEFQRLQ